MKRFVALAAAVTLLWNVFAIGVYADASVTRGSTQKKILLYLKPDLTIELNGLRQIFKDVNGQAVYPVIYNGNTYLPVRAISAIMNEPIEWDAGSKTIFIGKTLAYPVKSLAPNPTGAAVSVDNDYVAQTPKPSMVEAFSKPDVLVMYDFVVQSFQDVNGDTVYPVIYNGSTYLPLRAVSKLMNEPIVWDGATQKILIGNREKESIESKDATAEEISPAASVLIDLFEREEALYYEATAKITSMKNATSTEEKQVIAASASENYLRAQQLNAEAKSIDHTTFTEEEKTAYETLIAFMESTEYYILVLENIAYLAAADSDYSMLAETFLYFAMESQSKMEETRELIIQ